jgi:RNA polymerase sigma-70 factor (family 1)
MESFRRGEKEGFNYCYKKHSRSLCFFANGFMKDVSAAEDVVAETFIRIWNRREELSGIQNIEAYLYRSVKNACLREMESRQKAKVKSQRTGVEINEAVITEDSYEHNIIRTELMKEIYANIELLPRECKKVFAKLYIEGKTVREAAEELQLSASTIKTQRERAIAFLKSKLSPLGLLALLAIIG